LIRVNAAAAEGGKNDGPIVLEGLMRSREEPPKAEDLMSAPVVSVRPEALVADVARTMLAHGISAVPVMAKGGLVGIISEGDLLRRSEIGTAPRHSWLGSMMMSGEELAAEFLRTHGPRARDVMTKNVITVGPDTALKDIVETFEANKIKRVIVVNDQTVLGVVSRRDILRALVAVEPEKFDGMLSADQIRDVILANIASAGLASYQVDLKVFGDQAVISAVVASDVVAQALVAAVEATPGIAEVRNEITIVPQIISGAL
jgi:CBS domain-containing protein